jgi:hypothetical protein
MAGTILSHQVKFFAGSVPKPAASHSERSEESLFFCCQSIEGIFRAVFGMTECMLTRVLNISDCA